jgi:hypothetical protein
MNQIRSHYLRRGKVATALLAAGVLVGALLMADGLVQRTPGGDTAVAVINGYPITQRRFSAALQQMIPDQSSGVTQAQAGAVLDRLIEEELLLQRGLEIGITERDSSIRKSLVDAMIQSLVSAPQPVPDEATLESFYRANQAYFSGTPALQVRRMVFRGEDRRTRAAVAHVALADQAWDVVAGQLADPDFVQLPTSFIPLTKLRNYLGAGFTERLGSMEIGEFTAPLEQASSFSILLLMDLQPAVPPPFAAVQDLVLREYRRREDDAVLRSAFQSMRAEAEVKIDREFMAQLEEPWPLTDAE